MAHTACEFDLGSPSSTKVRRWTNQIKWTGVCHKQTPQVQQDDTETTVSSNTSQWEGKGKSSATRAPGIVVVRRLPARTGSCALAGLNEAASFCEPPSQFLTWHRGRIRGNEAKQLGSDISVTKSCARRWQDGISCLLSQSMPSACPSSPAPDGWLVQLRGSHHLRFRPGCKIGRVGLRRHLVKYSCLSWSIHFVEWNHFVKFI